MVCVHSRHQLFLPSVRKDDHEVRASRPNVGLIHTVPNGSITLEEMGNRFRMLEVRCGKCARIGRLRIDKLIEQHGPDMTLPDLRDHLAGECEHRKATRRNDRCQVFYPQLREMRGVIRASGV